jgi:lysophospholipase L1-like esterase
MRHRGVSHFLLALGAVAAGACAASGTPKESPSAVPTSEVIAKVVSESAPQSKGAEGNSARPASLLLGQQQSLLASDVERDDVPRPSSLVDRKLPGLDSFYQALDDLRAGHRAEPVRIFWLGDSHTAADFMTHPFRQHLGRIFGDGGPGFLRLGLDGYRHGAATIKSFGTIRRAPILPAQRTRVLDGVFGYGGIRTRPQSASGVVVELKNKNEAEVRWTLSYRMEAGASLEVRLGDEKHLLHADFSNSSDGSDSFESIHSFSMVGRADEPFSVRQVSGDPELFGSFCEYTKPGIVLDTTGIDGARTATTLAWEPSQFVQEVARRDPELLVVAYGTNEVFDNTAVTRYPQHTKDLIARAREAIPGLPCWVIGPPDSAKKGGGSLARVTLVTDAQRAAAKEMGCAFTSAFELMGGDASFSRWMKERPAMARGDRIHFTIAGYERLGILLAERLVSDPAEPPTRPQPNPLSLPSFDASVEPPESSF